MTEYEDLVVVELEHEDGYRFWSKPMTNDEAQEYIHRHGQLGYYVSDIDRPAL